MNFKFTSLSIFIILLVILIITIIFTCRSPEGFVSFNETTPILNQLYITQYSTDNLVYKLYDSIYYDSLNGNVIEVFGKPFSDSPPNDKYTKDIDTIGSSLTDIVLMSRSSNTKSPMLVNYFNNSNSPLSVDKTLVKNGMTNSYNYSITPNNSNYLAKSSITYNYQVLYISCGKDTLIHIYDCSPQNNVNIGTFLFRQSFDPVQYLYSGSMISTLGSYIQDNKESNNSYVKEPLYDINKQNSLFQLSANVLFDTTCRYLIIRNKGGLIAYDGTLGKDGFTPNKVESTENTPTKINTKNFNNFNVLYIQDPDGANFILYVPVPSSTKTIVAVVSMDPSVPGYLSIRNTVVFNQENKVNGIDGNDQVVNIVNNTTDSSMNLNVIHGDEYPYKESSENTFKKKNISDIPSLDSIIANYYSKYFNNNLPVESVNGVKKYSNDFLLKTQVIPPICPSCQTQNINISSCANCNLNNNDISGVNQTTPKTASKFELPTFTSPTLPTSQTIPTLYPASSILPTLPLTSSILPTLPLTSSISPPLPLTSSILPTLPLTSSIPAQPIPTSSSSLMSSTKLSAVPVEGQYSESSFLDQKPTISNPKVPDGTPDKYSYYGSLPEKKSSDFLPNTNDLSKFSK
jgi:hypothetical protein